MSFEPVSSYANFVQRYLTDLRLATILQLMKSLAVKERELGPTVTLKSSHKIFFFVSCALVSLSLSVTGKKRRKLCDSLRATDWKS